jgi:hypothetical protein
MCKALTVRTPPLQVCSLKTTVTVASEGSVTFTIWLLHVLEKFPGETEFPPTVMLSPVTNEDPVPHDTQEESAVAERERMLGRVTATPARNELELQLLSDALAQATSTVTVPLPLIGPQPHPLVSVAGPLRPEGRSPEPFRIVAVAEAWQPWHGQVAAEPATAEVTVVMAGATQTAPPTIALFLRNSRRFCSIAASPFHVVVRLVVAFHNRPREHIATPT